ncbi:MAG: DUF2059 domain-containing protein [Pseudomonadota bacterium]
MLKHPLIIASCAALLGTSAPAFAQQEEQGAQQAEEEIVLSADGEVAEGQEDFEFLSPEEEALAEFEKELTESFELFGELFKPEPLTAEQEALLPLAEQMTDTILPEGSLSLVMRDSMAPLTETMLGAIAENPKIRLTALTGVQADALEDISEDKAQEALDIFDPQFAERTEKMGEIIIDMVSQMFSAMEPAYREAYARSLAARFDEAEMTELLAFFDTPLGAKFAYESFAVQYDPQMLGVMEQMGPAMVEVLPGMVAKFEDFEAQFAKERRFGELSQTERERAAALLGKSVPELEALQPDEQEPETRDDDEVFEEV